MYGELVPIVASAAFASGLKPVQSLKTVHRLWLVISIALLVTIPVFGYPMTTYCRGMIGDLSVTSLVFLSLMLYSNLVSRPLPKTFSLTQIKLVIFKLF